MAINTIYNNKNVNEIIAELSKTRLSNMRTLQLRREEIYEKLPEIKSIDEDIRSYSLKAARDRIRQKTSDIDISQYIAALSDKKRDILVKNDYPSDYLDEIFECPICKDTGFVNGERCRCLNQKIVDELYVQSNIKDKIKQENFDNFSLDYYSKEVIAPNKYSAHANMTGILKNLHSFIDNYETDKGNILFYGDTGLGKTFLSSCIAKELLDKGYSVLYLTSNQLFYDVIQEYSTSLERSPELTSLYRYIFNCDLLIIDDLGTEQLTDSRVSRFYDIVNQRQIAKKSTVISTNLSLKQLQERYSERIMSRLISDYKCYYIFGDDIRIQKRRASM